MNGPTPTSGGPFGPAAPPAPWRVVGAGDFNADNRCDVLWFHPTTGNLVAWLMNGVTALEARQLSPAFVSNTQETVATVVDLNGDGSSDIVWQNVVFRGTHRLAHERDDGVGRRGAQPLGSARSHLEHRWRR